MEKIIAFILVVLTFSQFGLSRTNSSMIVVNPSINNAVEAFEDESFKKRQYQLNGIQSQDLMQISTMFFAWINTQDSLHYLKDFDPQNMYFQFMTNSASPNLVGVCVIIPQNEMRKEFYTTFGSGLSSPLERCMQTYCAWYNDGEILTAILDVSNGKVTNFKNWRLEQEKTENDEAENVYYCDLEINSKRIPKKSSALVSLMVDGKERNRIELSGQNKIQLPKGKISTVVYYLDGRIKGVMCFDLSKITPNCPMYYATTVYMKERLGYEKILYTQPKCEGIFEWTLIDQSTFSDLTNMEWKDIEFKN